VSAGGDAILIIQEFAEARRRLIALGAAGYR
jgi:hypothetical protein